MPDYPMSKNLMDFLSKCLRKDPKSRLSVDQALNHPFLYDKAP